MIKKEALELIDVEMESTKITLVFLDDKAGLVHNVNWNKQVYENGKWIDNPEKAEKVESWSNDYFGCPCVELPTKIGERKDVYVYDKFCSLWESSQTAKFTADMKGEIYQTTIKEVVIDEFAIRIRYDIDGNTYESKKVTGKYIESMKKWFKDPVQEAKQIEKFEEHYGVSIDETDMLIGLPIVVEVKAAFGDKLYGDIKKPKRK